MNSIKAIQRIPVNIEKAWSFFSNPANLRLITPPEMKFTTLSSFEGSIYAGQLIEYKVRPLLGIPLYWMTEITSVDELNSFTDEQRKGPYRVWKHQHYFKQIEGGVEMTDIVHYQLPYGILGKMMHGITVKKKLKALFHYRYLQIEKLLGSWQGQEPVIQFT